MIKPKREKGKAAKFLMEKQRMSEIMSKGIVNDICYDIVTYKRKKVEKNGWNFAVF